MTNNTETTAPKIDTDLRAAGDRGRIDPDAPPAPAGGDEHAEDPAPAPVDLDDDALDALLADITTRRETLASPGVKLRLAKQVPQFAQEIDVWTARAEAAEARAEAAVAAAARPRPRPLHGGGAAPTGPASPGRDDVLRAAVAVARGEASVPRPMTGFVEGGGTASATVRGL